MSEMIFVSSAQKELKAERRAIKDYVHADPLLNRFFGVFLFEDLPALFADRLEVWNPGELPNALTPDRLRKPHTSIPRNPAIATSLYLAHYIEKAGTGTLDMIALCSGAGLPEPDFRQDGTQFIQTRWRDWLTETCLSGIDLNERQRKAIDHIKLARKITNAEYQRLAKALKKTATRDLDDLVEKGVLRRIGRTGRGTYYVATRKGDKKGTKGT